MMHRAKRRMRAIAAKASQDLPKGSTAFIWLCVSVVAAVAAVFAVGAVSAVAVVDGFDRFPVHSKL